MNYAVPANLGGIDTSLRSLTGAIEWKSIKVQPLNLPTLPRERNPSRYHAARATDSAPITVGYRLIGVVKDDAIIEAPSLDGSVTQLRSDLETVLVAQGLFAKEAQAMVETWKDSWFEAGSRLIYIVARGAIDTILPLEIEPAAQTERVFVGRIELITPETLQAAERALTASNWTALRQYGHFVQPVLDRVYTANPSLAKQRGKVQAAIHAGQCEN